MKEYLLIGNNISGSLSPLLHNYLINKMKLDAIYKLRDISEQFFHMEMKKILSDENIAGFNVTIPYKIDIIKYMNILDKSSQISGAVNCVVKKNGEFTGYNTDVYGFSRDINEKITLKDLEVGILGFGGGSRAVITAFLDSKVKNIVILSRNIEKTRQLVEKWSIIKSSRVRVIVAESFDDLLGVNLIINCSPVRNPEITPSKFENLRFFYDLNYYNLDKNFIKMLNSSGVNYFEGGGMLVYQAAKAFEIWFNKKPPLIDMIDLFYSEID